MFYSVHTFIVLQRVVIVQKYSSKLHILTSIQIVGSHPNLIFF